MSLLKIFSLKACIPHHHPKEVLAVSNPPIAFNKNSNPLVLTAVDIQKYALRSAQQWSSMTETARDEANDWLDEAIDEYLGPFKIEIQNPATTLEVRRQLGRTYVEAKLALDELTAEQTRVEKQEAKQKHRQQKLRKWHELAQQIAASTQKVAELAGLRKSDLRPSQQRLSS